MELERCGCTAYQKRHLRSKPVLSDTGELYPAIIRSSTVIQIFSAESYEFSATLSSPGQVDKIAVSWCKIPKAHTGTTSIINLCSTIATCDPAKDILDLLKGDEDLSVLQRRASTRSNREAYQTVTHESLLNKTSRPLIDRRQ